jgi:hypothetical protein
MTFISDFLHRKMANSWLVTAITFLFLAHLSSGSSSGPWDFDCYGTTYTLNSPYERNLKMAATRLEIKLVSSPTLFATTIGTISEETVYTLGQCRGDAKLSACRRCIIQSFKDAEQLCGLRKGAIIYGDLCTLGHYRKNLLSFPFHTSKKTISMKIDSIVFKDAVGNLSVAVTDTVITSPKHFGTGRKEVDAVEYRATVYALAQCLPSLSSDGCSWCLADLISVLGSDELTAGREATLQCSYRFGLYRFFSGEPTLSLPAERSQGEYFYTR